MKIRLLLSAILLFVFYGAMAQNPVATAQDSAQAELDTAWRTGGIINLNFNQVAVDNWAEGGDDLISGAGFVHLSLDYITRKKTWENYLDLGYGLSKQEGDQVKKIDDRIDLNSKYGRLASGKLYYSALLNFHTQFSKGYDYLDNDSNVLLSNFFAPAVLILSVGLDWRPTNYFSFYFSPATGKITFVNDQQLADQGSFGVEPAEYDLITGARIKEGENIRAEFGAAIAITFKKEIVHNVLLDTKLGLFENYTDKVVSNRKNIDVNWTVLLTMTVNKFLNASIGTTLIYDHNTPVPIYGKDADGQKIQTGTGPRTQFKEVLSIGIGYKF